MTMITLKDHDLAMRTTKCPACHRMPGHPCHSKKANRVHPSRIKAMRAPDGSVHPRLAKSKPERTAVRAARKAAKMEAQDFYASWEWKKARYEVLKVQGRRCQCCGWQPGDTSGNYLVVDHIKPRSKYPRMALDLSNMQVLCNDCNMGKSNVHEDDFRRVELADDWDPFDDGLSPLSFDDMHKATIQ